MKYILVDGNNMACRICFSQGDLKTQSGISSGLHFGFFSSLLSLKNKFKNAQFLISWDGHSKRRIQESEEAVKLGIVPSIYKANRKKDITPQPLLDFYEQAPYLKRALEYTGIPQIRLDKFETDDIISSYCKLLEKENEIICITSDQDYFQLLNKNVSIYDSMKNRNITELSFKEEYEIEPKQWVDVGALMGDDSDGISGTVGVGEKTALKEIKKYMTWEKVIEVYKEKHKSLLIKYPSYNNPSETEVNEFKKEVVEAKSEKGKLIFPEVKIDMPYARVILAFAKCEVKIPKVELMLMAFAERTKLAYSLKKMDIIPDLPEIEQGELNRDRLLEYFDYYDIETLKDGIDIFGE